MAGLVCGLALACYWPALRGGLLWDDDAHVTRPDLRSWAGLERIWFQMRATQQYYPVLHSAFWVEHRLWGDAMLGYHLLNVLLHAASCCLLALVLRRLWGPEPAATGPPGGIPAGAEWLAALIFAVHPVCVESVAWISEQKNTLSLLFYLLAAYAYLDFDAGRRRRSYGWALGFFLLALGTKSVTATLPAALLVMLWWRNGRLSWRRDAVPLLPWFAVAVISGLFTAWVERTVVGAEGARFDLTFGHRLLLAGRVIWFYLGKLVWPADLAFIYPRWDVPAAAAGWYGWLGGAVAVTVVLWLIRRRARGPLAGWLFFVGSLFPALGFFNVYPFLYSYVADHFQYLASLGVITTGAAGIARGLAGAPAAIRAGGGALCAVLVLGLAFLANRQSGIYRDSETLYRATLALDPGCWMAQSNLAAELAKMPGREAEAISQYEQALRLKPQYPELHFNLGIQLSRAPGRQDDAIAQYREAVRLKPDYAAAHLNLAIELSKVRARVPEALVHYQEALRLQPDLAEAHNDYAVELGRLPDRLPEALAQYEEALRLRPDYGEAHYNLAGALANLPGREAEAVAHYEQAVRLKPDYAQAHNSLGIAYARLGRLEEARKQWNEALRQKPDYEEARQNLRLLDQLQGR